jgi:phosphatidylglycerol lysyltransferase
MCYKQIIFTTTGVLAMIKRKHILQLLKILLPIAIIIFIYLQGRKELMGIDPSTLLIELHSNTWEQILLMVLLGVVANFSLMLYDFIFIRQLSVQLPFTRILKISWIANSINNVIGFGGVAGASLRAILFKKYTGISNNDLMSKIVWITPLMLSGLSVLAWLPLFSMVPIEPLYNVHEWLRYAIWGMAAYLPIYTFFLLIKRRKRLELEFSLTILASLIEWLFAAIALWGITYILGNHVPFPIILAIFIPSAIAGVISLVPGGFGSFDLMVVFGMAYYGISDNDILVILLFYRICYYLVPFVIGLVLASTEAVSHTRTILEQNKDIFGYRILRAVPNYVVTNLSYWALSILIFLSGILLLMSAAMPGTVGRIYFAQELLSSHLIYLSNQLSVTAGFSLLMLSRSIQLKVKEAYLLTYVVLIAGAFFTFSKGFDFEEALILLGITALLRLSKKQFYRKRQPLSLHAFFTMSALTIGSLVSYISIGYFEQPFEKLHIPKIIKELLIKEPTELLITAIIGLILALLFNFLGFKLLAPKSVPFEEENLAKLESFLTEYSGNVLTHLAFLKDKKFFWSKDEDVFMMYGTMSDKLVVLGDPIGSKASFQKAIKELDQYADSYGLTPIFYQVNKEMLPFYHENGYQFFKLGEEAYVDLNEFSLVGKKRASLRAVKNKFDREGYTFSVNLPPFQHDFLEKLSHISHEWLNHRKEKGFSLGFFDYEYLQRAPIAILNNPDGEPIAFASLMPVYDKETISIDLMRYKKNLPNGTMDMIFLSLMEYAKEQNYQWFNLGMAPLANVGKNNKSFFDEKVAALIYQYGHSFYAFEGVRKYKEKFTTRWEPKYLAFRGRTSLPITMFKLSLLIGRKKRVMKNG